MDPDVMYAINDVMKFSISEISNDDISGTGGAIDFVFNNNNNNNNNRFV